MTAINTMIGSIRQCAYDEVMFLYGNDSLSINLIEDWFRANLEKPDSAWKHLESVSLSEIWQMVRYGIDLKDARLVCH